MDSQKEADKAQQKTPKWPMFLLPHFCFMYLEVSQWVFHMKTFFTFTTILSFVSSMNEEIGPDCLEEEEVNYQRDHFSGFLADFEPCEIFDEEGNDVLNKDMLEEKIADSALNDVYLETDARRLSPEIFKHEFIPLLVQLLDKENIEKVVIRLVGHLTQAEEGFDCIFASTIDDISLFEPLIPFGKCGLNKLFFASDFVKIWCWSKGEEDMVTNFMAENFSCIGTQFDEVPVGYRTE